jgi:hypothetical protein
LTPRRACRFGYGRTSPEVGRTARVDVGFIVSLIWYVIVHLKEGGEGRRSLCEDRIRIDITEVCRFGYRRSSGSWKDTSIRSRRMTGTRLTWKRYGNGDRRENKQVISIETLCCSRAGDLPGRLRSNEGGFIRWLKVKTGKNPGLVGMVSLWNGCTKVSRHDHITLLQPNLAT